MLFETAEPMDRENALHIVMALPLGLASLALLGGFSGMTSDTCGYVYSLSH